MYMPQLKLENIRVILRNFQIPLVAINFLKDHTDNSPYMTFKNMLGYLTFDNVCFLKLTVRFSEKNYRGQISERIFAPKGG